MGLHCGGAGRQMISYLCIHDGCGYLCNSRSIASSLSSSYRMRGLFRAHVCYASNEV